jgi:cytochrome c peroxidase
VQSFQQTLTGLMGGTGLSQSELDALAVYLNTLQPLTSPLRKPDGSLPKAAIEGAVVFQQAGCAVCHTSPRFTDRLMHDVGTGEPFHDNPSGKGQKVAETMGTSFDTPSLRELWLTAPYLHDGRAMTLGDVLVAFNNNDKHGTTAHLSGTELFALEAFLLTLPLTPKEFSELRGK